MSSLPGLRPFGARAAKLVYGRVMSDNQPPPYPGPEGQYPPPPPGSPQPPHGSYPPPPPPGGFAPAYSLGDALGWGWRKFGQNVGPIVIGILVSILAFIVIGAISAVIGGTDRFDMDASPELSVRGLVGNIVTGVLGSLLAAGWVRAFLDVADGRGFDLIDGLKRIPVVPVLLAALIVWAGTTVGFILLIIPGLLVMFLTYLTNWALLDDASPNAWTAITRSVSVVWSNFGAALVLAIVTVLICLLGALALVIGLAVALPMTGLAATYAWRMWTNRPVAP